ncbi:MAG: sigma-70 family RNA polymerase sigma factor [Oscillospiraceae bacterium]|jgi:RNA polymerase sigma-70 factor (ECF subfamily)|nr:sigma-70 family RNA polymerase sigma factor [Oscillospiraceae bacterium]
MTGPNIPLRFDELYNATHRSVLSYITAKCCNTADIQDIAQEVYVELYQLLEKRGVDYIKNEKALALRIARQKLSRHYSRMERLRMAVSMTQSNDAGDEVAITELEAEEFLMEDFVADKLLLDEVRELFQSKPQDVKKVFYLFYGLGQTIPEIARALSLSESNVKHKLYRTLQQLRAQFK